MKLELKPDPFNQSYVELNSIELETLQSILAEINDEEGRILIIKTGWKGRVENYVSLIEGTPLPYKTEFANTPLTGIFALDYNRLCRFANVGDRIELDENLVKKYLENGMIKKLDEKPEYYSIEKVGSGSPKSKKKQGDVYETVNAAEERKEITSALLKSLAVLRGGAKQASIWNRCSTQSYDNGWTYYRKSHF